MARITLYPMIADGAVGAVQVNFTPVVSVPSVADKPVAGAILNQPTSALLDSESPAVETARTI
jgi:hypothetical protein